MIIGVRDEPTCTNNTKLMGYAILALHAAELALGIVFGLCLAVSGAFRGTMARCIQIFGALWTLVILGVFIATQYYLYGENNDCKESTLAFCVGAGTG